MNPTNPVVGIHGTPGIDQRGQRRRDPKAGEQFRRALESGQDQGAEPEARPDGDGGAAAARVLHRPTPSTLQLRTLPVRKDLGGQGRHVDVVA